MPKVAIFAERMLPSTQTFIPLQVNELRRYTPQYVGLIPAERNYPLSVEPILLSHDRTSGSRIRRELYRWTGVAPSFHRAVHLSGVNLLHAHFAEGASPALFLSRALNLPLVIHLRGGAELFSEAELRRLPFEWPYLAFRKQLWKRASRFLCVSQFICDQAARAGFPKDKLGVHHTGMNFDTFHVKLPVEDRDPNLVLYVGRLVPYKGCDYLLRAMQRVQQRRPNAHLVVIGDGHFRPALEQLAGELQLSCQFLGEQKQSVVRDWLERARVFCLPSVTIEGGMAEAFGNVFSEAQAMGVPVVSSRHGGIPETMLEGVTGLLAPERDVEMLAAHLLRYLEDDGFWNYSRTQAMTWVRQHFDVRTQTAKLEQTYDCVVQGFNPHAFAQTAPPESAV
jgi:glycosyltransferase involved in cell wall biosynthesis